MDETKRDKAMRILKNACIIIIIAICFSLFLRFVDWFVSVVPWWVNLGLFFGIVIGMSIVISWIEEAKKE
jgi:predicted tellurium resistance membrane protein TerC